jgi:general secretion pathway protein D
VPYYHHHYFSYLLYYLNKGRILIGTFLVKPLLIKIFLISISFLLVSCQELSKHKKIGDEASRSDFDKLTEPEREFFAKKEKPLIKEVRYPSNFYQKVSVSISENQPLKPFLIALANQVKVDLQLDPSIKSRTFFSINNRPFIDVIEQICDITGLRFTINKNILRIEVDTPFSRNYNVQFLNLERQSNNHIGSATDVFSQNSSQKGANGENGSNSSVNVKGSNDFWLELEQNLKIILSSSGKTKATYSTHKQAGIITVFGTSQHHKQVDEYLKKIRHSATSQVLIEAKIVEVVLKDEFKSGINWQKMGDSGALRVSGKFGDNAAKSTLLSPSSHHSDMVNLGATGKTFSAILKAIEEFGSSRTLSSPRLTVMNNQTAILKVAQNQVYFRLNYDKQYSTKVEREDIRVSSDIQTVPIGLVMSVQPSIDPETGEVILFLRPTISRLKESIPDPAVDIARSMQNNNNQTETTPSLIPVVEVREIDSILRLKDGEIAVLGGLMEVRSVKEFSQLPGAGDIPILGDLFKSNADGSYIVELVILLRARIKEDGVTPHASDWKTIGYLPDSRPFERG